MSNGQKQEKFGKTKYKVGFLGYFDVSWLYGREPTDAALRDLLYGHQPHRGGGGGGGGCEPLPRLSITVDKKQLNITQTILNGKTGKNKVRFPGISRNDVLFVSQGSEADIDGIVGCVYYCDQTSNNNTTGPNKPWPLTVHGYLFESAKLANRFARHVRQFTETAEHRDVLVRREKELVDSGQLIPDPRLPAGQFLMSRTHSPDYDDDDQTPQPPQGAGNLGPGASQSHYTTEDIGVGNSSTAAAADTVSSDSSSGGGVKKRPARLPRTTLIFPEDGNHGIGRDGSTYDGNLSRYAPGTDDLGLEPNRSRIPGSWAAECPDGLTAEEDQSSSRLDVDVRSSGAVEEEEPSVVRESSFSSSSAGHGRLPRTRPTSCLAAEFKNKLAQGPILLPPKDYDTFSRTRGTMAGIEERKCLNPKIVGNISSSNL